MAGNEEIGMDCWKGSAATLFNPYLNLNRMSSNISRQESIRTRILTPTRHSRAPPESLVGTGNSKSKTPDSEKRKFSKQFPTPDAAEDVSIYVQQMIHNQFCGRSGTPSDMRYENDENHRVRRSKSTPTSRFNLQQTIPSSQNPSRVSEYELDHFFTQANEQMSRMALTIPGRESSFSETFLSSRESPSRRRNGQRFTLADVCNIASDVGDKMSQSKEKVGLEAIRGFRLPSARLTYEPYEHHPMNGPLVLGQPTPTESIRLRDVLNDDNYSNEAMIEILPSDHPEEKISRNLRSQLKSTTPSPAKTIEFKDWRGKISQANLPDVRTRLRRDNSATLISPQRPCTAASNLSKSRPTSSGVMINSTEKEEEEENHQRQKQETPQSEFNTDRTKSSSLLKSPSSYKQRKRTFPLNVRIDETNLKEEISQNVHFTDKDKSEDQSHQMINEQQIIDPPSLSLSSETIDEKLRTREIKPRPTPDRIKSKSTSPTNAFLQNTNNEENGELNEISVKRNYKLIPSPSKQIYRTVPETNFNSNSNSTNDRFNQLTLTQLELLENYDPMISARIGVPFLPVQILARPNQNQQTSTKSIQQIQRHYPKKNGQPIFEPRNSRSAQSLIGVAQTLQLTKSKRIRVERQTTFEKPQDESIIEQTIQIKSLENPHRLALVLYSPSDPSSLVKHTNSTRTSSKANPSQIDDISMVHQQHDYQIPLSNRLNEEQQEKRNEHVETNFSVLNIRTGQEVDQMRQRQRILPKRSVLSTSIVTNTNLHSSAQRHLRDHGRPIPSVFLTEDPDEINYSTSIYRQARNEVDITRAFKGFLVQNIRKKLSAEERKEREDRQRAAIQIQRAYRKHLKRRHQIEIRRPPLTEWKEQERQHRRILSAKRAQFVQEQLIDQSKIREENHQYEQMIEHTGPSLKIYASFNRIDAQFSKSTLNRAATCIQRWWRGFIIRHRSNQIKAEIEQFGLTWRQFSSRYREIIQRIQKIRQSEYRQFIFKVDEARQFLQMEKRLTTIFQSLSFNHKLEEYELEQFFQASNLSATKNEIEEALTLVLQHYPQKKGDSLTKEIVFDVVYYIYPPLGTGLSTSRKSTWVRPIIDGEDETAIQGTPFLEPIDLNVINKFLGQQ